MKDLEYQKMRAKQHEMARRSMKPTTELAGEAKQKFIDEFVANRSIDGYPSPRQLCLDENLGMELTGNLFVDLEREVDRAYQLMPDVELPQPRWLASDILLSVDINLSMPLGEALPSKISVPLVLAHLEALGHRLDGVLSSSIARRATLLLWNHRHKRECPALRRRSDADRPSIQVDVAASPRPRPVHPSLGAAQNPAPEQSHVEETPAPRPRLAKTEGPVVLDDLQIVDKVRFARDEFIEVDTIVPMMKPTEREYREIQRIYERDVQWQGKNARHWVVIRFAGRRRMIPGTSVRRMSVADEAASA